MLNSCDTLVHINIALLALDFAIVSALAQYITMTSYWERWRLKSPASPLFAPLLVQAKIKENIKAPRHWHLRGIHR